MLTVQVGRNYLDVTDVQLATAPLRVMVAASGPARHKMPGGPIPYSVWEDGALRCEGLMDFPKARRGDRLTADIEILVRPQA